MSKIVIVSVNYGSPAFLEYNIGLVASSNVDADYSWIVVDNGSDPPLDTAAYKNVQIESGFAKEEFENGSYHHAAALNKAVGKCAADFLLIIDPDFYVLQENWLKHTAEYMVRNNIAIFGAPWHPRHHQKIRYFPSPHFMLINTRIVSKSDLDFTPELDAYGNRKRFLRSLQLPTIMVSLLTVGTSWDTGYRVYKKFGKNRFVKIGLLSPVWDKRISDLDLVKKFVCQLLPDRINVFPKKHGYYTGDNPIPKGVSLKGAEVFLFEEQLFGIHFRNCMNSERDISEKIRVVPELLSKIDKTR